jgi:hypothetical protein
MTEHEKIQEIIRKKRQAPVALDPRRTALIIVDVQRFFTRPESEFAQVFQKLAPGATDGYFQRVSPVSILVGHQEFVFVQRTFDFNSTNA